MKIEQNPLTVIQTQELDDTGLLNDSLSVSIPNDETLLDAQYMAVRSHEGNAQSFDMYRIIDSQTSGEVTYFTGIQLAYYELAGYVVEDLRPSDRTVTYVAEQLLADTEWRVGYVGDLPNITTNFYYTSVKDAFTQLQSVAGCEVVFKVEISGQGVIDKWVEIYPQLGNKTRKRFTYGDTALDVVREIGQNDVYTALIGQGKGEESGDGFGRKITFEDVAWTSPVVKPLGQKYVELEELTSQFGIPVVGGKRPRIGVVEFDTEDPTELLQLTYQALIDVSRPKVLFKASVVNIGDANIGDTVTIHRYDLGLHYETRIRKVERDKLNNNHTRIELGDIVHESSIRKTNSIIRDVSNQIDNIQSSINNVGRTADGKNAITWGNDEPLIMRTGDLWYRDHPVNAGERQMMVYDGNAWVEQQYRADMLTGTFDANTLNVININVDSIVGNKSTFVQSAWNAISNTVRIDGSGVTLRRNDGTINAKLTTSGMEFWLDGEEHGMLGVREYTGAESYLAGRQSVSLFARNDSYVGLSYEGAVGSSPEGEGNIALSVLGSSGYIRAHNRMYFGRDSNAQINPTIDGNLNITGESAVALGYRRYDEFTRIMDVRAGGMRMYNQLNMNTHDIQGIGTLFFDSSQQARVVVNSGDMNISALNVLALGLRADGVFNRVMDIRSGGARMYGLLNMNGHEIQNQSDIRLKTNVEDSNVEALKEIERLKFIEFDWDETNPANEGKPKNRQFGIVAQYTPFLQVKAPESESYLSVDMTKQVNLNSMAIQELARKVAEIDERTGVE